MPIYAYKCESCGFSKDVLQKISDTPLQDCPTCGKATFKKQLTAAGFQLKGSGWYVTDFKGGSAPATAVAPANSDSGAAASADSAAKPADSKAADSKTADSKSADSKPAAAPSAGSSTPGTST